VSIHEGVIVPCQHPDNYITHRTYKILSLISVYRTIICGSDLLLDICGELIKTAGEISSLQAAATTLKKLWCAECTMGLVEGKQK
jgi:hypothetical protein